MNNCVVLIKGNVINGCLNTSIEVKGDTDVALNMLLDSVIVMANDYNVDLSLILEYLIDNAKGISRYGSKNC